jgi:serine/threonine protein kinase
VACYIGHDHIALKFKKYEMTLREYLEDYRDPLQLGEIFVNIINGVKELHEMGYIHRDLKPDNVVLNRRPLQVEVIDFNRATSTSIMTKGSVRGTPGYFPLREEWRNGSDKWDIWALAAMILEADMDKREYFRCF